MPVEIELKFRVASHEPVRASLRAAGAEPLGSCVETNRILDRPDGLLFQQGCGLRVRSARDDEHGSTKGSLTFKGPRASGPFKAREELEVEISDAERTAEILSLLGFVPVVRYEKKRESWRVGDCRVELDEPPGIGKFVEIEGPDQAAIRKVQHELGLDAAVIEPRSYVELLMEYCRAEGIDARMLRL